MTDNELVSRIESLTLSPREFGHREHVQLAFALLRDSDGSDRFCRALQAFATSIGAAAKYNQALTSRWLSLVAARMATGVYANSDDFFSAHPDLLDKSKVA